MSFYVPDSISLMKFTSLNKDSLFSILQIIQTNYPV